MITLEQLYAKYLAAGGAVTIDSRHIPLGALFFAIRGPHFNGNSFAAEALEKGASYAIIDDSTYAGASAAYILVQDSLATLLQLARYHRLQYGTHFALIAVTGSYGKTTSKELMHKVLSTIYKTTATQGNLNTQIGVALTLLSMELDREIAVVEMGASQLGDITLCCNIALPTHGIITAIGAAHLEGFLDMEGVIQGKRELYNYLYATGGKVFVNSLDPILSAMCSPFHQPITYPQSDDFAPLALVAESPYLCYRSPEGSEVTTHLLGKPHFYNIAAALCVAKYFHIPMEVAHQAIQDYIPSNQRMQLMIKGSNQLIIDSYNATPASVQAALDALLQLKVSQRIVILGDMAELGNEAAVWHQTIVEQLIHPHYDQIFLCGPLFTVAASQQPAAHIYAFPHKEPLADYLQHCHFQHSGILLKGAHSLALHSLVKQIK